MRRVVLLISVVVLAATTWILLRPPPHEGPHRPDEPTPGTPDVPEVDYWWRKARIGAQGPDGYAEVMTGGGWRAVTKEGASSGPGGMDYDHDMPLYIQDMADWLAGTSEHPCNFDSAYKGHEIMMGACRSIVDGGQVALPLQDGRDELDDLRAKMPDTPVLLSMEANREEYLGNG